MKSGTKGYVMLFITAAIWGVSFVAQSSAMDYIGPFTYQALRFLIGALTLVPVLIIRRRKKETREYNRRYTWFGGILCGAALCAASSFQQIAISYGASTGKAGFITAMYIIIVPVLGIFLRKKVPVRIWICAAVSMAGLYFLSVKDGFTVNRYDILLLAGAFGFAVQIMLVDYFVPKTDGVLLSAIQFMTTGIISLVIMFIRESPDTVIIMKAWKPVLYGGILSCGVAYTLQVIAQKYVSPGESSIIMSFESPFALIGEILILHQIPECKEWIGIGLMFAAIIVSQINKKEIGETEQTWEK